jgi:PTS system nitrogen regulatory IIA component
MHDMIILDLKSKDRDPLLKEIVAFVKKRNRISKEKDLFEKLLQRENLGSTAIGEGVAIPHCKIKGIKSPIVALALSKQGVNFYAIDKKPSHIFFIVVSSPDNPSLNLQILAAIAHLVRKGKALKKKILEADNIDAILDVICEEEDKLSE